MQSFHRIISGDQHTPPRLAAMLKAPMLLESASLSMHQGRFSIIMVEEAFRLVQRDTQVMLHRRPSIHKMQNNSKEPPSPQLLDAPTLLDALPRFYEQHSELDTLGLPVPAGGIGYVGFPFCRFCDTIAYSDALHIDGDPIGIPDAIIMFGHIYIICDHYHDHLHVIGLNYEESSIDLVQSVNDLVTCIQTPAKFEHKLSEDPPPVRDVAEKSTSEQEYQTGVQNLHQDFKDGNLYQCVLSRRITVESSVSAFDAYRRLRSVNPSPYMFYLDFGDFQLIGASPEMHAKVVDQRATIRPIAGTCRRGKNAEEDAQLTKTLQENPKERAEHLMLVDLARNDLGRICEPGSIETTALMEPEYFSSVIHLTSNVVGKLKAGMTPADVIKASFPAGTLSGAPKIRAIETLPKHERFSRSFYGGIVGHFEANGNFDSCIVIRSALYKGGEWVVQVGGGIVMDSYPERELEETKEKSKAVLAALGITTKSKPHRNRP